MPYAKCKMCGKRSIYYPSEYPLRIIDLKTHRRKHLCADCLVRASEKIEAMNVVHFYFPDLPKGQLRKLASKMRRFRVRKRLEVAV